MGRGQIAQVSLHPNVCLMTPKQEYSNTRVLDREKTVNTAINKPILNYYMVYKHSTTDRDLSLLASIF